MLFLRLMLMVVIGGVCAGCLASKATPIVLTGSDKAVAWETTQLEEYLGDWEGYAYQKGDELNTDETVKVHLFRQSKNAIMMTVALESAKDSNCNFTLSDLGVVSITTPGGKKFIGALTLSPSLEETLISPPYLLLGNMEEQADGSMIVYGVCFLNAVKKPAVEGDEIAVGIDPEMKFSMCHALIASLPELYQYLDNNKFQLIPLAKIHRASNADAGAAVAAEKK